MKNDFFKQGKQLRRNGKMEEALLKFRKAIDLEPNNPKIYNSLGHLILNSQFSEKLDTLEEALKAYSKVVALTSGSDLLVDKDRKKIESLEKLHKEGCKKIKKVLDKAADLVIINQAPYTKIILYSGQSGLCNRLRALSSCLCLSYFWNIPLLMCWHPNEECNCHFDRLYEPVCETISPESILRHLVDGKDSSKILYINKRNTPRQFHEQYLKKDIDYQTFFNKYSSFVREMKIKKKLLKDAEYFINKYWENEIIGIHIRRTDHIDYIQKLGLESSFSSDDKVVKAIEKEIANGCSKFFIATDNEETKNFIDKKFPGKIISYCQNFNPQEQRQTSVEDALIDLYLLSKTKKIIGSYRSSFNKYAAVLGNIPFIYP